MSLCCEIRKGFFARACLLLLFSLTVLCTAVLAQQQTPPKFDLFAGYQWLNPGGNIPGGTDSTGAVTPFKLPSMPAGFGLAGAYNFHPNFALEGDFGGNYKSGNDFQTYSVGPRAMYRGDNVNMFVHTPVSYTHLTLPTKA